MPERPYSGLVGLMGYQPDSRPQLTGDRRRWLICGFDQRLLLDVYAPKELSRLDALRATLKFVGDLPVGTVKVEISKDDSLLSTSADPKDDEAVVPFYPPRARFPWSVATVRRGDLIEVDRLESRRDLVTYSPKPGETRKVEMKYYYHPAYAADMWHEANCVMRIPRHPNIVSFDALVIDKIGGVDRAVGFTTAHIPGDPL
jgi:hypothetical protein